VKNKPCTKYALLGTLMSGPKHGYDILQSLNSAIGSALHVSTSQLYVLLKRLERDGLLTSSVSSQDSLPSKRIFSLTPAGKKVFLEWLRRPVKHVRDLRLEFVVKLFFFHRLSLEGGDDLIQAQVLALEKVREGISREQEKEKDPFNRLVFTLRLYTIGIWLHWINQEIIPFMRKEGRYHG